MRRQSSARAAFGAWLLLLALSAAVWAQPLDPPRGDMRIAVFGDFNGPYGSRSYPPPVARAMRAIVEVWRPNLLLSPGDVVAGQRRNLSDATLASMWAAFDHEIARPLRDAGIPYAVALGNHDASSLRDVRGRFVFARDRRQAEAYWGRPMYAENLAYVDRARHPYDYAFRAGEVFVAVIDASSAQVDDRQRVWLRDILAHPAATSARMRLVVGHLPLVAVAHGRDRPGEVVEGATALRRIMENGNVSAYVSGHHAAYFPGRLGQLELLFAGGVGGKRLLAGAAPPRSTATLMDVWYDPLVVRYTTFDLATMEVVPPESLPSVIGGGAQAVRRSQRGGPWAVAAEP